jgi:hypothetical protein
MDVSRCGATGSQLTSSGTLGDDFPTAAAVQYVASASRPPPWKGRTPAAVGRRLGGRGTETTSNPEPLMLRAMGIGAGYHAPQETAAALQALRPHMSSEGQPGLLREPRSHVSPDQRPDLERAAAARHGTPAERGQGARPAGRPRGPEHDKRPVGLMCCVMPPGNRRQSAGALGSRGSKASQTVPAEDVTPPGFLLFAFPL